MKGEESSRNKAKRLPPFKLALILIQIAIILSISLTVLTVKSPKVRYGPIHVDAIATNNNDTSTTSFDMKLTAQITVKNVNFGDFNYDNSSVTLSYGGHLVGSAFVPEGRAMARSIHNFSVAMDISSEGLSNRTYLSIDMNSGTLFLAGRGQLRGKVHLLKNILMKKTTSELRCTIGIDLLCREVGVICL